MARLMSLVLKRSADILISFGVLVILFGPFLVLAIVIRINSSGPAFFRQTRIGKDEHTFRIWKFRTLVHDENRLEPQPPPQADDPQLTKIGRFLRRSGIDELPQLINVLKGEMSLVGPRPILMHRAALLGEELKLRSRMRPGITGLAVIRGRNDLTWEQKIDFDLWYVEHFSLWLDLKIALSTPRILMWGVGVYIDPSESLSSDRPDTVASEGTDQSPTSASSNRGTQA